MDALSMQPETVEETCPHCGTVTKRGPLTLAPLVECCSSLSISWGSGACELARFRTVDGIALVKIKHAWHQLDDVKTAIEAMLCSS